MIKSYSKLKVPSLQDFFDFYGKVPSLHSWEFVPTVRRLKQAVTEGSYTSQVATDAFREVVKAAAALYAFAEGGSHRVTFPPKVQEEATTRFVTEFEANHL